MAEKLSKQLFNKINGFIGFIPNVRFYHLRNLTNWIWQGQEIECFRVVNLATRIFSYPFVLLSVAPILLHL